MLGVLSISPNLQPKMLILNPTSFGQERNLSDPEFTTLATESAVVRRCWLPQLQKKDPKRRILKLSYVSYRAHILRVWGCHISLLSLGFWFVLLLLVRWGRPGVNVNRLYTFNLLVLIFRFSVWFRFKGSSRALQFGRTVSHVCNELQLPGLGTWRGDLDTLTTVSIRQISPYLAYLGGLRGHIIGLEVQLQVITLKSHVRYFLNQCSM